MNSARDYHTINANQNSIVHAGDSHTSIFISPQPCLSNVSQRSTISLPTRDGFVDRDDELSALQAVFCQPRCRRAALHGLGGVGKSRIALEFASWFICSVPSAWVFWVDAGTPTAFRRSFERIAEKVRLQRRAGPRANIMQIVSDWLLTSTESWLIILDGLDSDHALQTPECSNKPLSTYLPLCERGFILITSRDLGAPQVLGCEPSHMIEVKPLKKPAALALLSMRSGIDAGLESDAEDLVELLDYIPLAITQAAAYLHNKAGALSIKEYSRYLQDADTQLLILQETFADLGRQNVPNNSILHTWQMTFEYVRRSDMHACGLLSLMSFLDGSAIPETLLASPTSTAFHLKTKHIPLLLRSSLIEIVPIEDKDEDGKQYHMHGLVQLAARAWLKHNNQLNEWRRKALQTVNSVFPYGEDKWADWRICANLFPHVRKILSHYQHSDDDLVRADLLCKAAWYHRQRGDYHRAAQDCQESLRLRKDTLGRDNPVALHTGKELAHIYRDLEQWADAEAELQWVLEGLESSDGPEQEEILDTRSLIGELKVLQNQLPEGQKVLQDVLEVQTNCLGATNQYTLLTTRKLGLAFMRQNKLDIAQTFLESAWTNQKVHPNLGLEHLNTIRTGMLLAQLYRGQASSCASAIDVLEQVLGASKVLLGDQHAETLAAKQQLGEARDELLKQRRWTT